jgi:hypothetical protein
MGVGCSKEANEHSTVVSSDAGKGTAPASDVVKKEDDALVRFVNATASSKDLAFGDTTPFTNVGARDVTEYKPIPAQRHDFKLLMDGDATKASVTDNEGLSAGKHYTVLALTEKSGKYALDSVADDLTPPAAGKAKVRVINLAAGVNDVNLYLGGSNTAVISGAVLNRPTDYKEVAPSAGTLDIRNAAGKRKAEEVKDVQLEAGKLYTVLVFEDAGGKLKVKTIQDEFTTAAS